MCGLKIIVPTDFLDKIGTGILEEDLELQICEVENRHINSNNPETIVSPGDGNPDDEGTHLLSVTVPISQFDRSKSDPPNIIGLVLKFDQRDYQIGTRTAKIKGRLARNQIEFIIFTRLKFEDIPDEEFSLFEHKVYVVVRDFVDVIAGRPYERGGQQGHLARASTSKGASSPSKVFQNIQGS